MDYEIQMRSVTHFAHDTPDGDVECQCGKTAGTIDKLAILHARSRAVLPGWRAVDPAEG